MTQAPTFLRHFAWPIATVLLTFSAQAQEKDSDWPLVFTSGDDQVQVFRPQPESFDGTSFTARAAVALQRPQDSSPIFGAIWGNGILAVDRSDRMGTLNTFKVTDARFPGITDTDEQLRIREMLSEGIPAHAAPIPIDWLVAALEEEKQSAASYDNAPPTIIYKDKPSILVFIDGDPIYEAVKIDDQGGDPVYAGSGPELERVANTPYLLVRPKGGMNWLYGSGLWYSSETALGPWTYEKKAPAALEALAQKVDTTGTTEKPVDGIIPEVIVTTKPAVLLDINGAPQMQPFDNTSLMYVTNTDKDVFLMIPTQEYYFLASGRWYASKDLQNGPWRYVAPEDLPVDFAKVPEGSTKDGILAHVSGTNAAREAVRDAAIPQTAQVSRGNVTLQVSYDGDPQFQQIAGTDVYSALNASTTVLRIDGRYHVCDNAVWYDGDTPDGPWTVSTSVPSQVNEIPPSDPNYRVRYVYIYDSTPDDVFVGYTPGYLGSYVQGGTVIYGTGYYYNPWRSSFWYPRPYTWGFNMYYNPWYGWGFGNSWGYDWFYPRWNYYGYYSTHSWGWWGPYAYCPGSWNGYGYGHGYGNGYGHFYGHGYGENNGNGTRYGHRGSFAGSSGARSSRSDLRSNDLYSNHRVTGVRPSVVERRSTVTNERDGTKARTNGIVDKKTAGRDYFIDRKGNVFRSDGDRTEELHNGEWSKTATPVGRGSTTGSRDELINKTPDERTPAGQPDRTRTMPEKQPGSTQPGRNNTFPERQPQNAPDRSPNNTPVRDPQRIQQERSRGDQRVNDFRGYQQQRNTPPVRHTPSPTRNTPTHTAPTRNTPTHTAPTRSTSPTHSAPSAPGRGTGGGNSGGRRPR